MLKYFTRERISFYFDRFCYWIIGLIAGLRIDTSELYKVKGYRDRMFEGDPQRGICGHDRKDKPSRTDKRRSNSIGADFYYFVGSRAGYLRIRKAFESAGLEYKGTYYSTARDCHGGVDTTA